MRELRTEWEPKILTDELTPEEKQFYWAVVEHVRREAAADNGYLEHAMEEMNFSARAHARILRVARTLADLSGSPDIRSNNILEAIQYRSLKRKLFS